RAILILTMRSPQERRWPDPSWEQATDDPPAASTRRRGRTRAAAGPRALLEHPTPVAALGHRPQGRRAAQARQHRDEPDVPVPLRAVLAPAAAAGVHHLAPGAGPARR